MSLQLKDFEQIKARAIHADIQPHQENLSADEVELKNTAQQAMTKAEDQFEIFLATIKGEIHQTIEKNTKINHLIDSNGLLLCGDNEDKILRAVVTYIQKDFESHEDAYAIRKELMKSEGTWLRFRAENQLTREARYSTDLVRHFTVIIVIFTAETLANMFFYANDDGLFGGFLVAAVLSLVSLGVCGGLGFWARYANLLQPSWKKAGGMVAIGLLVTFLLFYNLVLVIYRDMLHMAELAEMANSPSFTVVLSAMKDTITGRMLPALNPMNIGFFGLSVLLGIISAWKGYTFRDPYPGYQDVDESKQKYQQEYDGLILNVKPDLTISKLISQLDGLIRDSQNLHSINTLKSQLLAKKEEYQVTHDRLNHDLSTAIDYFREQHLPIRATGMSTPVYFVKNDRVVVKFREISTDAVFFSIDEALEKNRLLDERIKSQVTPVLSLINLHRPRIATDARSEFIRQVDLSAEKSIHPVV